MRAHRISLLTALILLTLSIASAASAATYYVATPANGGSNTNPGTLASPFATITKGVSVLTPGDVLYVRGGTYNEKVTIWNKYGTSTAQIWISPYNGESVAIDGTGITSNGVVEIGGNSSYINFDSFEVKNGTSGGIYVYNANNLQIRWNNVHDNQSNGISITSSSSSPIGTTHHVRVEENSVHHNVLSNQSRTASSWQQGLSAYRASNVDMIHNWVYENYGEGVDYICSDYGNIVNNQIWDNFSVDLYLDNAQYTKVDRNFIVTGWATTPTDYYRSSNPACGICTANETYTEQNPLTDLTITNNIVLYCHFGFAYSNGEYGGGLHNTLIANNTFVKANDLLLYIQNGSTNVHDTTTVENNIFYQTTGLNYSYATSTAITYLTNCWYGGNANTQKSGTGDVLSNPLFVNASGSDAVDFKLTSTSPCINAGTTASAVTTDYWGTSRSGTFDIGAHEY